MKNQDVTDMDLQALLDNELEQAERTRVLSALEQDEKLRQRYEQFLNQKSMVQYWWAQGARDH